ncbi:hypothetical protein PL10110_390008 [Planktothrix agardhii]|nr:hypothetical protein PL10110_390008 [Planktothrix agardhii]
MCYSATHSYSRSRWLVYDGQALNVTTKTQRHKEVVNINLLIDITLVPLSQQRIIISDRRLIC